MLIPRMFSLFFISLSVVSLFFRLPFSLFSGDSQQMCYVIKQEIASLSTCSSWNASTRMVRFHLKCVTGSVETDRANWATLRRRLSIVHLHLVGICDGFHLYGCVSRRVEILSPVMCIFFTGSSLIRLRAREGRGRGVSGCDKATSDRRSNLDL